MKDSVGGLLARGGGLRLTSHKSRCLRITWFHSTCLYLSIPAEFQIVSISVSMVDAFDIFDGIAINGESLRGFHPQSSVFLSRELVHQERGPRSL